MPYLLSNDEVCTLLSFLATCNSTFPQEVKGLIWKLATAHLDASTSGGNLNSPQAAQDLNNTTVSVNSTLNRAVNTQHLLKPVTNASVSSGNSGSVVHGALHASSVSSEGQRTKKTKTRHGGGSGGSGGPSSVHCKSRNAKLLAAAVPTNINTATEVNIDNVFENTSDQRRERYHVDGPALAALLALASACDAILKPNNNNKYILSGTLTMLDILHEERPWDSTHNENDNSLSSVFTRVQHSNTLISYAYLQHVFNLIHFRTKLEDVKRTLMLKNPKITLSAAMKMELGEAQNANEYRVRYHYVNEGSIFSILAGSASIYILLIIAASHLRTLITRTPMSDILTIARAIRDPDPETDPGKMIIHSIIPAIAYLQRSIDFDFTAVFSKYMSEDQLSPVGIRSSDLKMTDAFFDSISFECFRKPRNGMFWKTCLELQTNIPTYLVLESGALHKMSSIVPSTPSLSGAWHDPLSSPTIAPSSPASYADFFDGPLTPIQSSDEESDDECCQSRDEIRIATNFDLKDKRNVKFPIEHRSDINLRRLYTTTERKLALKAKSPKSLRLFTEKLQKCLSGGVKKNQASYLRLRRKLCDNKVLRIEDKNNDPLVVLSTNMPDSIRCKLLIRLKAIFPLDFQNTNTSEDQEKYSFLARHYTTYNRYGIQAINANFQQEPYEYTRPGVSATNCTKMFIPRSSNELRMDLDRYNALQEAFADVFDWQRQELKRILPEEYELLQQWVDVLPGNQSSPVYPFGGFVINLNVATSAHRDEKDFHSLCLIIVISDCEGGELALVEPGVVLELKTGDMVVFRSADLTHFNLDFDGLRASIVLHSDSSAQSWINDRNGWANSKYFN